MHGTRMMSWQEIRELYGREVVNLRNEGRWVFLNTLFSVSEGVMYTQVGRGTHACTRTCVWRAALQHRQPPGRGSLAHCCYPPSDGWAEPAAGLARWWLRKLGSYVRMSAALVAMEEGWHNPLQ